MVSAAASCSNSTRNITGGGEETAGVDRIQYIFIASTGNATDFGDLTIVQANHCSGSSTTRGLWAGGIQWAAGDTNVISYVTIASSGNATDFGNLMQLVLLNDPASSSNTSFLRGGGMVVSKSNRLCNHCLNW